MQTNTEGGSNLIRLRLTTIYPLMAIGVALMFLGHGILALKGDEKFVGLVTASYDELLGSTVSADTATSLVNVIGAIDVLAAAAFLALALAARRGRTIAYSVGAMWLFGAAGAWAFITALSRFTATLNGAQIWDVVERGANFVLPLVLVYVIHVARQQHAFASDRPGAAAHPTETASTSA
jgi:hypothetical protein